MFQRGRDHDYHGDARHDGERNRFSVPTTDGIEGSATSPSDGRKQATSRLGLSDDERGRQDSDWRSIKDGAGMIMNRVASFFVPSRLDQVCTISPEEMRYLEERVNDIEERYANLEAIALSRGIRKSGGDRR